MKKRLKSIFFIFLVITLFISNKTNVLANELKDTSIDKLTALKEAIKKDNKIGTYDITISVPGYEKEKISGYNFIIVMDGSYSTDGEEVWNKMRQSVIEMVNSLLPEEDSSKNINKVALISFGVDYHINIPLTNDKSIFDKTLPYYKGGSLLQPGRSATNTEAGLKGAREYIESIKNTSLEKDKNHTYVIYLSDGGVNLTETPFNYYNYLINNNSYYSNVRATLATTLVNLDQSDETITYDELFTTMMKELRYLYSGNEQDETSIKNIIDELGLNSETIVNFLNEKLVDFFEYCGYDINKEYSAGEFERMFVNKQLITGNNSLRNYLLNIIYYALSSCSKRGQNGVARTITEGNRLKEYATIYTIGYNAWREDAKLILDPEYGTNTYETHYSSSYSYANSTSINEKLKNLIADIVKVNYKNPTIIDYTSKWVKPLDINGDGIFDEKDIIITNNNQLINNANIKVTKLTKEEINKLNDPELNNNTNDEIYCITWIITDYLHSWDKYQLTYSIKVDTQEENFISEKEYHANGNITLTYDIIENTADNDGNTIENITSENVSGEIDIKDYVSQKENIIIIIKKDQDGNLLEGADFDIKNNTEGNKQITKEYSTNGIDYTNDNSNLNATYFRFKGLYDYIYTIYETITPNNYITSKEIQIDKSNSEGTTEKLTITNTQKIGTTIIHYIVKINDKYIPFNEFAYDEFNNLLQIFENKNINDIILTGKLTEEYQTTYEDIEGLTLEGLYLGNYLNNNLIKLNTNSITNKFQEETTEYTYIFNINIGTNEEYPEPPQTGYTKKDNILYNLLVYLLIFITKLF